MAGDVVGPSAGQVARRVVILKGLVGAAGWVRLRRSAACFQNEEKREAFVRELDVKWSRHLGFWADQAVAEGVSPKERAIVAGGIGGMTAAQEVACSWRREAVQALMWALGKIDVLPPYDTMALEGLLKDVPTKEVGAFIEGAQLRPVREIEKARSAAELWHWRSRTRQLITRGEVLRATEGLFPAIESEDFPVRGIAYRDLSLSEWKDVSSVTVERHFALNWLCGRAPGNRWDETPTGT
jgi:hypothetical protein